MDLDNPDALTHWEYQRRLFSYREQATIIAKQYNGKQPVIVDVGCGAGDGTNMLSEQFDNVLGLDNNPSVLKNTGHYQCLDVVTDDLPPCDVVIANQFLEHLEKPDVFLSKVFRALRPGGMFIGSTPDRDCRLRSDEKPFNADHFEEYTPEALRNLFALNKWESIYIPGVYLHPDIAKWETVRIANCNVEFHDPHNLWRTNELAGELNNYFTKLFVGFIKSRIPANINGEPFTLSSRGKDDLAYDLMAIAKKGLDVL